MEDLQWGCGGRGVNSPSSTYHTIYLLARYSYFRRNSADIIATKLMKRTTTDFVDVDIIYVLLRGDAYRYYPINKETFSNFSILGT